MSDPWNTTSASETHGEAIGQNSRMLAIILAAMTMGQFVFGAYVLATNDWEKAPTGTAMSLFGVVLGVQAFVLSFAIPALIAKKGIPKAQGNIDQLLKVYQVKTVVAGALLEGAGFLNIVMFMLEHNLWSFGPVALGLALKLSMIPTATRLTSWLDGARRRPDE